MKTRHILITILTLATVWHTAAAQPKKKNIQEEAHPRERDCWETKLMPRMRCRTRCWQLTST